MEKNVKKFGANKTGITGALSCLSIRKELAGILDQQSRLNRASYFLA